MFKFLLLTFIGLQLSVFLAAQNQLHHTASGKIIDTYLGEVDSNALLSRINEKFQYRIFANSPDTLLVNYTSYNNNGQLKENIEGEDIENDFVESFRGYSYINENTFQVKEIFNIPTYAIYKNRFLKKYDLVDYANFNGVLKIKYPVEENKQINITSVYKLSDGKKFLSVSDYDKNENHLLATGYWNISFPNDFSYIKKADTLREEGFLFLTSPYPGNENYIERRKIDTLTANMVEYVLKSVAAVENEAPFYYKVTCEYNKEGNKTRIVKYIQNESTVLASENFVYKYGIHLQEHQIDSDPGHPGFEEVNIYGNGLVVEKIQDNFAEQQGINIYYSYDENGLLEKEDVYVNKEFQYSDLHFYTFNSGRRVKEKKKLFERKKQLKDSYAAFSKYIQQSN
jgi:hypothetical protein